MKLRSGGYYKLRDGSVVGPLSYCGEHTLYPFRCSNRGISFTSEGQFDATRGATHNDIVSEVNVGSLGCFNWDEFHRVLCATNDFTPAQRKLIRDAIYAGKGEVAQPSCTVGSVWRYEGSLRVIIKPNGRFVAIDGNGVVANDDPAVDIRSGEYVWVANSLDDLVGGSDV